MKLKFGDSVIVTKGFYSGHEGIVLRGGTFNNNEAKDFVLVRFIVPGVFGVTLSVRALIPASDLEAT